MASIYLLCGSHQESAYNLFFNCMLAENGLLPLVRGGSSHLTAQGSNFMDATFAHQRASPRSTSLTQGQKEMSVCFYYLRLVQFQYCGHSQCSRCLLLESLLSLLLQESKVWDRSHLHHRHFRPMEDQKLGYFY